MASEPDVAEDNQTEVDAPGVSLDARHATKMAKKKAARDRMMATKSGEKGLVIVHTGAGQGKSSSAFGMIRRCVPHGFPPPARQSLHAGGAPRPRPPPPPPRPYPPPRGGPAEPTP